MTAAIGHVTMVDDFVVKDLTEGWQVQAPDIAAALVGARELRKQFPDHDIIITCTLVEAIRGED